MKTLPILAILFNVIALTAQNPVVLSKEEAMEDFKWLRTSLEYVHPRLYKYDSREAFDSRFDSAYNSIRDSTTGLDFLSMVSKINASVNCGHLYTIPQGKLKEQVLNKKVLPLYLKVINNELFVRHSCSEEKSIPQGSKILSINGKDTSEILALMVEGIATDGYIETRKSRLIERYLFYDIHGFDLYYHLHVDRSISFEVTYQPYGMAQRKTVKLDGVSIGERKKLLQDRYHRDEEAWLKKPSPQFELFEDENYGILTVSRSFFDEKVDPDYDTVLSETFETLKEKKIGNLILDLRNNEGGSEHHQIELMSYLYNKPFKLYQNIYLSHLDFRPLKPVVIERDSADFLFNNDDEYMRKLGNSLWINNYEYSRNLRLQSPKSDVFKGKLYVLMNGISFSSAADIISDIKKTTNATFIGEESGGTFEGPTGGNSIVVQLPNSKIMVRISPNIQMGYMYQKHPIGRGVLPDYEVEYSIEDVLAGRDLELDRAKTLISENKK
ncbi:S41 family peptidase [Flavobacteriaceae bacterium 3-367]